MVQLGGLRVSTKRRPHKLLEVQMLVAVVAAACMDSNADEMDQVVAEEDNHTHKGLGQEAAVLAE